MRLLNSLPNLGLPYYCFHDVDVVDYTNDVDDNEKTIAELSLLTSNKKQAESGVKLLWGTANLFSATEDI